MNKTTYTCGKWDHKKTDCKYNNNTDNEQTKQAQEMVFMATDKTTYAKDIEYHNNIWIGDSGATTHLVNSDEHLMNCTTIHEKITIGDGKDIIATKKGTLPGAVKQLDGSIKQVYIEVKYAPELWCNLLSITKLLKNGWNIQNKGMVVTVSKGNTSITFDHISETRDGFVMGAEIFPQQPQAQHMAASAMGAGKLFPLLTVHQRFGHPSEAITRSTATTMNLRTTGKLDECEDCRIGKAKQKAINKTNEKQSTIAGERLCIDISSIKGCSLGGRTFWNLTVDEATNMAWSHFLRKKSDLATKFIPFCWNYMRNIAKRLNTSAATMQARITL